MERIARAFSQLLAKNGTALSDLPTAGELVLEEMQKHKTPTALVFLDACRFDLGERLASLINDGEPAQRAHVAAAAAPVPSVTALGMPFALPIERKGLTVALSDKQEKFRVTAEGFAGDLTQAEQRRNWLRENADVKECLSVGEVLDGEELKRPSKGRQVIAVYGDEFDSHDGTLELTGADDHLRRYVKAIHRLRDAGYSRIIVATDHGFFHWQPDDQDIEVEMPAGDILWRHRRAMVGHNLSHPTCVPLAVPQSDLEVMVPRGMSAFQTYGGLGFFHGGVTLQEVIIPVVVVNWPAKARKVPVVLKPVGVIATEVPRVQVQAGATGQITMFGADSNLLARRVVVKVKDPCSGKVVFRQDDPITVEPQSKPITVPLRIVEPRPELPYGATLVVEVLDADDEELLAREDVSLKIELTDW